MVWDEFLLTSKLVSSTTKRLPTSFVVVFVCQKKSWVICYSALTLKKIYMQELLDILYDGFGGNRRRKDDIHSRMAMLGKVFGTKLDRKQVSLMVRTLVKMIKYANGIRQERGDKKINIKGLDLDDDD